MTMMGSRVGFDWAWMGGRFLGSFRVEGESGGSTLWSPLPGRTQRQPPQPRQRHQQWFEDEVTDEVESDEELGKEYSDEELFVSEKEGVLFLYGDGEVDLIFFENSDNFDEAPKFDDDGYDFVEDELVFRDDGFVIEVISHSKSPQMLEDVVGDAVVEKCRNNYPVEGVVGAKVKFATVKHFCLLTKDELVVDILQDPHNGVSVDNFNLMVEVPNVVPHRHIPSNNDEFIQFVFE
ncbi:hypothetical protein Sjap_000652 [Stephania japonica]|uniref:Uncharacterized protein n=1 Tax=Stephania japonica TaxID=461633 RepID=A0AAP0PQY3_9MAGN